MITYIDIFGKEQYITPSDLRVIYENFYNGAKNIPASKRLAYFYEHHVKNITFLELKCLLNQKN